MWLSEAFVAPKTMHSRSGFNHQHHPSVHHSTIAAQRFTTSSLVLSAQSPQNSDATTSSSISPILAALDVVALVGFAAVGKASHAPDGSIDLGAVLVTAFPFVTAWLATSPLTGIYQPLDSSPSSTTIDVAREALFQTAKGWAIAVPLGCALRGVIKGYVPPAPFVIVTLIATLVILSVVRVAYAVATSSLQED